MSDPLKLRQVRALIDELIETAQESVQEETESLRQKLDEVQAELEAERNRRFEGNRISSQEYNDSQKQVVMLRDALNKMNRAYVNLIENARDRIITLGGDCDHVDVMERSDPNLLESKEALAATADPDEFQSDIQAAAGGLSQTPL